MGIFHPHHEAGSRKAMQWRSASRCSRCWFFLSVCPFVPFEHWKTCWRWPPTACRTLTGRKLGLPIGHFIQRKTVEAKNMLHQQLGSFICRGQLLKRDAVNHLANLVHNGEDNSVSTGASHIVRRSHDQKPYIVLQRTPGMMSNQVSDHPTLLLPTDELGR